MQPAQYDVRVCHRGLPAAPAITGRPRFRPRALWPHPERTTLFKVGHGSATRSAIAYLQHRNKKGMSHDRGFGGDLQDAVHQQADIEARAPHIHCYQVAAIQPTTHLPGTDCPAHRAGQQGVDSLSLGRLGSHQATVGLHDRQPSPEAAPGKRRLQLGEIAPDHRRQVSIEHSCAGPLILAPFIGHLVRKRNVQLWRPIGQEPTDALLVAGIGVGVQRADRYRVDLPALYFPQGSVQLRL